MSAAAASPAASPPVTVSEVLDLTSVGIASANIRFGNLCLESDKFVAVREQAGEAVNLAIVDLQSPASGVTRLPLPGMDACLMNPVSRVVAVRSGTALAILNVDVRAKQKSHRLPDGTQVVYWRWISPSVVAFVTQTHVYHWSLDGDAQPVVMCDRSALSDCQVISYNVSPSGKWLLLAGIRKSADGAGVDGQLLLYSVDQQKAQPLSGHAGCFCTAKVRGESDPAEVIVFAERKPGESASRLMVVEMGRLDATAFRPAPQPIPYPADAQGDFPVSMIVVQEQELLYMSTKMGYLFLFDVHTGAALFRYRVAQETLFQLVPYSRTGGVLGVSAGRGKLYATALNERAVVPFVVGTLRNQALAVSLARRLGLPGAEEILVAQFASLLAAGDVKGAAQLAVSSPRGFMRTAETIARFQQLPAPGQLTYFTTALESGKLNRVESLELAKVALAQQNTGPIANWLKQDKLECSEELGDMISAFDQQLALTVYVRAQCHDKVLGALVSRGEFDKVVAYVTKVGHRPDFRYLLQNLVRSNPKAAEDFAKQLVRAEGGPYIDVASTADVFIQMGRVQEVTSFLLEALKENKPEDGALQTRLLEVNLLGGAPQVADAILSTGMFTHFDRARVASSCERAQLFQRAVELYTEMADVKRVISNFQLMKPEFLLGFFEKQEPAVAAELLQAMLAAQPRLFQPVAALATRNVDRVGAEALVAVFEKAQCAEGLFMFLGSVVNSSTSPLVHFKYIEVALKLQQLREVERMCRDSTAFEPRAVLDLLIENKLREPRPLVYVCDRFGFVEEMTAYLYANGMSKAIEVYVQSIRPQRAPTVVGKLLDMDANEEFIRALVANVGPLCPIEPLVEEVEKRNRLRMLQVWLEQRVSEGSTDPAAHNAIGKIYVMLNKEPAQFLNNNHFYEPRVVGKFCEKLDPYLAFLAYRHAWGACDDELVDVTTRNGLFKDLSRYLVERQDMPLWARALSADNPHKASVVEQVVSTALPESKNPEEVSTAVKAFMAANMPHELIGLLERLVLHGSDFADNKNLQNLLILTAIRAAPEKVMGLVERLTDFDGPQIAKVAASEQYALYEEAFAIYYKFERHVDAIEVLIDLVRDLARALEYAERVSQPDVWSCLAHAQTRAGDISAAIASYVRADDATRFADVIDVAEAAGAFEDLTRYLTMARTKLKEPRVDTELVYSFARTGSLSQLEEFIASPNVAQIQAVGDRCFGEQLFEAAKRLYSNISNNAKLASCLVALRQYREAVEAARKANSLRTWKEVNEACVAVGEFRLAQVCGLHIIVSPDHLEELLLHYERHGHSDELISLLEQGMTLDSAHPGIFTELGVLYSKYRPASLMDHLRASWSRMHVPKILRACEAGRYWHEAAFLFIETKDYDMALRTMMEHSPSAFAMDAFIDAAQRARNQELHYSALRFFVEYQPLQLPRLLLALAPKLDHARVVHQLARELAGSSMSIAMPYLKAVQRDNIANVNEAINAVYVEEENHEDLRASVDEFDNFDHAQLAQRLERHDLLEFRRIAALLYKRKKQYEKSCALSKKLNMFKDAIDTAAESADQKIAEDLLAFFVDAADREGFAATLYTCYHIVRPDVALELAWRNGMFDFVMPFVIQYVREVNARVHELEERTKDKPQQDAAAAAAQQQQQDAALAAGFGVGGGTMLALADSPYSMAPPPGGMMMMPPGGMMMPPGGMMMPPGGMMMPPGGMMMPPMGGGGF